MGTTDRTKLTALVPNLVNSQLADPVVLREAVSSLFDTVDDNFSEAQTDLSAHTAEANAHTAQNISYTGLVSGPTVKTALDNLKLILDTATGGDTNTFTVRIYGPVADGSSDHTAAIQSAINSIAVTGGRLVFGVGTYNFSSTIYVPENVSLQGIHTNANGTVLNYTGTGWAIKTSGNHQRNTIENFRLELNGNANGIMLGDLYVNLPAGQVPIQFELNDITVSGIGAAFTGIKTSNASHYRFIGVHIGFGTTAGIGLHIHGDNYNSGVATFVDCTLGRVDSNSVGLLVDGTVNLDCFSFTGCYFGGKTPIRIGQNTYVRNFNVFGGHIEGRNVGSTVNLIEIYKLFGGNFIGITFAGFIQANTNGIAFKGEIEHVNVLGCEANGVMGTIFFMDGATNVEDCMLQAPSMTNGSTATVFSATLADTNFKFDVRKFTTQNIRTKYLFSIDGSTKEYSASAPDATQAHSRGDTVKNTLTSRTRNISHWKCVTAGGAGAGVFQSYGVGWGTTTERTTGISPSLTTNDAGYQFHDTTLVKTFLWNGSSWLG